MAGNEQRPTDSVEGHMPLKRLDSEAVDEDAADVEGHTIKVRLGQDTEAVDEDQAGDDVEGYSAKIRLGQDTEAIDEEQAGGDDAEGHAVKYRG